MLLHHIEHKLITSSPSSTLTLKDVRKLKGLLDSNATKKYISLQNQGKLCRNVAIKSKMIR